LPGQIHAEAINQVWATHRRSLEPEVVVGQPLALGEAQALDALGWFTKRLI
jgi:hypothetical protein